MMKLRDVNSRQIGRLTSGTGTGAITSAKCKRLASSLTQQKLRAEHFAGFLEASYPVCFESSSISRPGSIWDLLYRIFRSKDPNFWVQFCRRWKSACPHGSSPAVSFWYGAGSQTELSKHIFVHRALRQSIRELCVDDRRVSACERNP